MYITRMYIHSIRTVLCGLTRHYHRGHESMVPKSSYGLFLLTLAAITSKYNTIFKFNSPFKLIISWSGEGRV